MGRLRRTQPKMKPLTIAIDGDGVLFDFVGALKLAWSEWCLQTWSFTPFPDIWDWNLSKCMPAKFLEFAFKSPDLARRVSPYQGAHKLIRTLLVELPHTVALVTTPLKVPACERATQLEENWRVARLQYWLQLCNDPATLDYRFDPLRMVSPTYPTVGRCPLRWLEDKTQFAADVFVDDKPANVNAYKEAYPSATVVLAVHDYNQGATLTDGIIWIDMRKPNRFKTLEFIIGEVSYRRR